VNTNKSTSTAMRKWIAFCNEHGFSHILNFEGPWDERRVETKKLVNFLQAESERRRKNGSRNINSCKTFEAYFFGIQRWHVEEGLKWNITYEFRVMKKRLRRQYGWGHKRKLPLFISTINDLETLMVLDTGNEDELIIILIMLLSVFGLLRISEILDLRYENVSLVKIGSRVAYDLKLVDSKTMQRNGRPENVMISPRHRKGNMNWCPFELLKLRMRSSGKSRGKIFEGITRKWYSKRLKKALHQIGVDSSRYDTHSGRIGGATMMWQAGVRPEEIKMYGRWSSECWTYYCRRLQSTWGRLAKKIANSELVINDVLDELVK